MAQQRIILITGTSRGIGLYLAKYYIEKRYKVFGCSRRPTSLKYKNYTHYEMDITEESKVIGMVQEIKNRFKRIDILINNAGIFSMNHSILTPIDTVKKIFETNFLGTFLFIREVGKIMVTQKWGRIINISTVAVPLAVEGESVYAASKSAIEEFTKITAKELGKYNITVNCVGFAPLMTDMLKSVPKNRIKEILNRLTLKRMAELRDVSNIIDFFIREESDFITGQIVYLGGA